MNTSIVYKITSKINGQYYIGAHTLRLKNDDYFGSGTRILRMIKKYGVNNFEKTILFEFEDRKLAFNKEKELLLTCLRDKKCVNIAVGGEGVYNFDKTYSEIYKDREILEKKKRSNAHKGMKFTEEHKRNLSLKKIGTKHSIETKKKIGLGQFGKKRSEETRKKLSLAQTGKPSKVLGKHWKLSEETRKNISNAKKGCIPWNKNRRWERKKNRERI